MQVLDNGAPTLKDAKRNLANAEHELETLSDTQAQAVVTESVKQALYSTREALAHIAAAEKAAS